MTLQDLKLLFCYDSGPNDLAEEFYIPCMKNSQRYDRAVGFFSSSIFQMNWRGLRYFLKNNGLIRIVCSQHMQLKDVKIMTSTKINAQNDIHDGLIKEIDKLMENESGRAALVVFSYLISTERLKLKIAVPESSLNSSSLSIFHSKVGIFTDEVGSKVVFKGSSNESNGAFSKDGNAETVDVYCSWINPNESKRVEKECQNFENLWKNEFTGLRVFEFPEAIKQKILKISDGKNINDFLKILENLPNEDDFEKINIDDLCLSVNKKFSMSLPLREHQIKSLKEWNQAGFKGLMEHATGSGKTVTGISAAITALNNGLSVIILVPSALLLAQWKLEIQKLIEPTPPVLLCGDGNRTWKNFGLKNWVSEAENPRIVISTISTACSDEFIEQLDQSSGWTLIVDEVHRIGSIGCEKFLRLNPEYRLGLSATPTRAGDPLGTKRIVDFFQTVLPTKFGLSDAIRLGVLTPYHYSIRTVELTQEEMEKWISISRKLAVLSSGQESGDSNCIAQIERLLIERFRIVKGAENKIEKAVNLIADRYSQGDRWIVYCDSVSQLESLFVGLSRTSITVSKYYAGMAGDQKQTLRFFERVGGVVLSIRCLDEGIDIPAASHALIIASSQNPREFIQRRGRVLRKSPNKSISYITDLITLPSLDYLDEEAKSCGRFITAELARASLFAKDAINPNVTFDIERIAERFAINIKENSEDGIENDLEENNE